MRDRAIILFPFERVEKGSKVAIYGSGDIAQAYYWELTKTGYAEVVAWIDKIWEDGRKLETPRMHMDEFSLAEFDKVVIGLNDRKESLTAQEYLLSLGVPLEKVIIADEVLHFNVRNLQIAEERKLRIGFIATGQIANIMALTTHDQCKGLELYAVASRSQEKAEAFKEKYGFIKAYGSYDELINDPNIEIVYITTPVNYHYEQTISALNAGKHVICEKPFAVNSKQAEEMIALAREKGLFLTDGVWSAYLPLAKYISGLMNHPAIGKVHMISANIQYPSLQDKRLTELEVCGGQILENGYYMLEFLNLVTGREPEDVEASCQLLESGVDFQTNVTLKYSGGLMAAFHMGLGCVSDLLGFVYGEKGFAVIRDVNQFKHLIIFDALGEIVEEHRSESGYWYELDACVNAIKEGKIETSERTHDLILRNTKLLDIIRKRAGVSYSEDV